MSIKDFLIKYKVFLLGLAASIVVAIQGFVGESEINWKAVIYAVVMATLSFVANQWRGQGVTIAGIVGTLAGVFVQLNQTGTFTWSQFIVSAIAAILAAVASPAKSLAYEKSATIMEAKDEAKVIDDKSALPKKP